jgi:hypothetical protein
MPLQCNISVMRPGPEHTEQLERAVMLEPTKANPAFSNDAQARPTIALPVQRLAVVKASPLRMPPQFLLDRLSKIVAQRLQAKIQQVHDTLENKRTAWLPNASIIET